ncbi:MAG: S8 family serine peptidase [Oscillospiraceae bacterium]|nr:S8 family serine peptidase [Oscillospiraceae bacterium]
MIHKKTEKPLGFTLFIAMLAAILLISTVPAAAYDGEGPDYIVKYKESEAYLMEDESVPFDVVSRAEALRLYNAGLLEWYEPDGVGYLLDDPSAGSEYYESYQWNLDVIKAEGAFRQGCLGRGVRIGIVDSGVNPHPDISDRLLPGRNYVEGTADEEDTSDRNGHGTAMAGLIAGAGEHGYIGVAPESEVIPLKITEGKSVKVSNICRAIYGGIDDFDCDILNLSLGVTDIYESLREAVEYAEQQGVFLVSASGNNGRTTLYYPAAYDTVAGVGMVDRDGVVADHSTHNESVMLTAPGVDVRSISASGSYSVYSGTSYAVPQVVGAAAVLLSIDGALTPADLRRLLSETATDIDSDGWDEYYGYGILNVSGSVAALTGGPSPPEPSMPDEPDTPCAFISASEIRNYTGEDIEATYLLATYDETGVCVKVKAWRLTLPAGETAEIEAPEENTVYGQFVCETATMTPLAKARKTL